MGNPVAMDTIPEDAEVESGVERKDSQQSKNSQTASDYIDEQLGLEADAREVLPYKFDSCSQALGPLKQKVFSCLTCSPPPASAAQLWSPAGVCYSCSIACHGEHDLAELFDKRNFSCDCGTTRISSNAPCTLRIDPVTGAKGVHSQEPVKTNSYNHNFQNRFCGCGEEYDPEKEKGTMFQCLGLGSVETGGCGEDWWHPECLLGLPKDAEGTKTEQNVPADSSNADDDEDEDKKLPPGFPAEEDFHSLLCYKCVSSDPWIKQYAGTPGFLPAAFKQDSMGFETKTEPLERSQTLKRKATDDEDEQGEMSMAKRIKEEKDLDIKPETPLKAETAAPSAPMHKHDALPPPPPGVFSLFLKEDFREHLCHCPKCYPHLIPHQQLVDEEEVYQPSESDSEASDAGPGSGTRSHGTGSLLDRGEAALSGVDRVRAIEGVMVYNHLKEKVKAFLKPYAESGQPVGAEDIKAYFEKLRGDEAAIKEAGSKALKDGDDGKEPDNRKEQGGY